MNNKGIIYIIRNVYNDKVYIGQTTEGVNVRWYKHKYNSKTKNTKLYKAMREYGTSSFYWEILDDDIPKYLLDSKEKHYIKVFNSIENGYNMEEGGKDKWRKIK